MLYTNFSHNKPLINILNSCTDSFYPKACKSAKISPSEPIPQNTAFTPKLASNRNSLDEIDLVAQIRILSFLDLKSLTTMMRTRKYWSDLILKQNHLFENFFKYKYNDSYKLMLKSETKGYAFFKRQFQLWDRLINNSAKIERLPLKEKGNNSVKTEKNPLQETENNSTVEYIGSSGGTLYVCTTSSAYLFNNGEECKVDIQNIRHDNPMAEALTNMHFDSWHDNLYISYGKDFYLINPRERESGLPYVKSLLKQEMLIDCFKITSGKLYAGLSDMYGTRFLKIWNEMQNEGDTVYILSNNQEDAGAYIEGIKCIAANGSMLSFSIPHAHVDFYPEIKLDINHILYMGDYTSTCDGYSPISFNLGYGYFSDLKYVNSKLIVCRDNCIHIIDHDTKSIVFDRKFDFLQRPSFDVFDDKILLPWGIYKLEDENTKEVGNIGVWKKIHVYNNKIICSERNRVYSIQEGQSSLLESIFRNVFGENSVTLLK